MALQSESIATLFGIMSVAGGLCLLLGLMAMMSMLMNQQRRRQELESLLPVQEDEGH